MCELLGMSANVPTDIRFSFSGLIERGGRTGPHRDGWGIAFYARNGCRTFLDPAPSYRSEVAALLREHAVKSRNVICHIRKATRGGPRLENTHPFVRELWGRAWAFAHNGRVFPVKKRPLTHYRPIGSTDSEHAFCWMLDRIREAFPAPPRNGRALARLIGELADDVARLGSFNFIMCDARNLYCYCSTDLAWITRRAPFGEASLIDAEMTVDFAKLAGRDDIVTVIATRALTRDESWRTMAPGELVVFHNGVPLTLRARTDAAVPA